MRRTDGPTTLDGTIIRVDPSTGAAAPGNPFGGSSDPNKGRVIAYGMRNPFRFTFRPGTDELWVGDVGPVTWEEIDRIASAVDATAENFGWPCYENSGTSAVRPRAQTLRTSDFVGVGPVDVVLPEPRALIELKWSYAMPPKIYESVWDAIKLVLLGQRLDYNALYIATGASREAWAASESADLFDDGEIDPAELWGRALVPRGVSTTARQSGRTA